MNSVTIIVSKLAKGFSNDGSQLYQKDFKF